MVTKKSSRGMEMMGINQQNVHSLWIDLEWWKNPSWVGEDLTKKR